MNYQLKGRIIAKYGTQSNFAVELGIDEPALSRKLSGRTKWTADEREKVEFLLSLSKIESKVLLGE